MSEKIIEAISLALATVSDPELHRPLPDLGTGLGFAIFYGGKLAPHFELSHATVRRGTTYDTWIGEQERRRLGNVFWSRRIRLLVEELRPVFKWDR